MIPVPVQAGDRGASDKGNKHGTERNQTREKTSESG